VSILARVGEQLKLTMNCLNSAPCFAIASIFGSFQEIIIVYTNIPNSLIIGHDQQNIWPFLGIMADAPAIDSVSEKDSNFNRRLNLVFITPVFESETLISIIESGINYSNYCKCGFAEIAFRS
jgi:hypothetical protein